MDTKFFWLRGAVAEYARQAPGWEHWMWIYLFLWTSNGELEA